VKYIRINEIPINKIYLPYKALKAKKLQMEKAVLINYTKLTVLFEANGKDH